MNPAVYIIAEIKVKEFKTYFEQYALKFNELLPNFQGEVLASTTKCEVIEGERFGNWTVIIKFPSKELAEACIHSEAYAPLAEVRIKELTTGGNVLMVPGY